ncbi:MAG: S-layer homology domain-containing protein [Lachnospiraceae bacterium]|nr:S-layer homology domain-containing protein [Lachnospiraceae bacterium]
MRKTAVLAAVAALVLMTSVGTAAAQTVFSDVPDPKDSVYWAVGKNIMSGKGDGTFDVNGPVTRGHMAVFLWKAAGKPQPAGSAKTFTDVPASHPYYKAVQWVSSRGISTGRADGSYGVSLPCTRGQTAVFLWKLKGRPAAKGSAQAFADVPADHSYYKAAQWAAENGILSADAKGNAGINAVCTRGEFARMLQKAVGAQAAAGHKHTWVADTKVVHYEELGHYEKQQISTRTVVDREAWDEPLYIRVYYCDECDYNTAGTVDEITEHIDGEHGGDAGFTMEYSDAGVIKHDPETHEEPVYGNVWVVDQEAHDETVTTGYRCSGCAAQK